MTLTDAASTGDRRTALEALRDALAAQLDDCTSKRDYAALSARFADTLRQLDEIDNPLKDAETTPLDEFRARLKEREFNSPKRRASS